MIGVHTGTTAVLAGSAPLQAVPGLFETPLGKLLVALVVVAVVLFVGRYVMNMAWKVLKLAIVAVAVLWLASVVAPAVGL